MFHTKHDPEFEARFKKEAGRDYAAVVKELVHEAENNMLLMNGGNFFKFGTIYQGKFEAQSVLNRLGVRYHDQERPPCDLEFKRWSQKKNFVQEYIDQGVASCEKARKAYDKIFAEDDRVEEKTIGLLEKFGRGR
jgi:hypothetical protein